jgi:RNA polymerase sigma-70 factor (ECF subfamily)
VSAVLRVVPPGANDDDPAAEAALIAAARAGDRGAFTRLFSGHVDRVRTHLTRLIGPSPERDDLVQQVFLQLHRALPTYRGDASLATFLHRITVNAALDHLRSRRRHTTLPLADAVLDGLVAPGVDGPARAQARDELRRLFRLLDRLTAKKRVAFLLVAVEGLSLADAAGMLDATEDTVKQRVLAARRELAVLIEDSERRGEGHG